MLNELERPSLNVSLDIEIPKMEAIKHDLGIVEKFVEKLDEFYTDALLEAGDNVDVKTVKAERTRVRKIMTTVADNRKNMVKAYKEPIKDFEDTSKRIERGLKSIDDRFKAIVDADKIANEDPFEGLSVNMNTYNLAITCTEEQFKEIKEFLDKKGIKY